MVHPSLIKSKSLLPKYNKIKLIFQLIKIVLSVSSIEYIVYSEEKKENRRFASWLAR